MCFTNHNWVSAELITLNPPLVLSPLRLSGFLGEIGNTFLKLLVHYKTRPVAVIIEEAARKTEKMEASMKCICLLGLLLVVVNIGGVVERVDGARECGRSSPDMEAWKLAPCATAGEDEQAEVSDSCCAQVKKMGRNPSCLCAVMLSQTAKSSGVKPEIAVTIPKRCNIADRPVGYRCGAYTLP